MKKLVRKMHSGVVPMYFNLDFVFKLNKRDWDGLQEVLNKLEAYEATEHTPEECAAAFEELAAYHAAEQDGTLLRLPCKVGDTVYMTIHGFVEETKVRTLFLGHPSYNRGEPDPSIEMIRVTNYDLRLRDFGKTVFQTRESAEAALKEQEANDGK